MFRSVRQRDRSDGDAGVDMAPLIDVVFILLIFFLVTTTFVHDRGLSVTRPDAVAAVNIETKSLRVKLDEQGAMRVDDRPVSTPELRAMVIDLLATNPKAAVVVVPVRSTPAGRLVEAINTVKGAGVADVALATEVQR